MIGVATAIHRRWTCDDAYISYRYALNLVEGRGLVFNAGERVEGFSNLLWTLWCAVGLLLNVSCETWTIVWGIVCYAFSILLLGWLTVRMQREIGRACIPLAAILLALHGDMTIYATSGLETSLFILLAILGFVILADGVLSGRNRPVAAGVVMTLATLTRPDGAIFAVVGGACLLWFSWPRWRNALLYAAAFGLPQVAVELWRHGYYGDWLPNTYYAKSGGLAWWSQGFSYLHLYLQKYVVLYLAIPALVICLWPRAGDSVSAKIRQLAVIAAALGAAYGLYVTRVGGDFMYARMLLPATPFLLIVIELSLVRMQVRLPLDLLIGSALAIGIVLPRWPMSGTLVIDGVANEWSYYDDALRHEQVSPVLRKYLDGLPVCMAFVGSEAHRMYKARIATAIESEAGLTDRFIAHQVLAQRGRVGHEKNAPLEYLIRERKAHFAFHPSAVEEFGLGSRIPRMTIDLDQVRGYILHWDPAIMGELGRRGAKFEDCPAFIDGLIKQLHHVPDQQVADWYRMLKLYYFEGLPQPDHARESPFLNRLRGTAG
ncbi:MAG TPA: hypothetical protein VMV81_00275 [Phycisphaerae bacterium]|nr:hypothetical protein [Phycisphaerae bacterium]